MPRYLFGESQAAHIDFAGDSGGDERAPAFLEQGDGAFCFADEGIEFARFEESDECDSACIVGGGTANRYAAQLPRDGSEVVCVAPPAIPRRVSRMYG